MNIEIFNFKLKSFSCCDKTVHNKRVNKEEDYACLL
nr:MAG TPA: hypothetical protein [Caudoviricetes sp.]